MLHHTRAVSPRHASTPSSSPTCPSALPRAPTQAINQRHPLHQGGGRGRSRQDRRRQQPRRPRRRSHPGWRRWSSPHFHASKSVHRVWAYRVQGKIHDAIDDLLVDVPSLSKPPAPSPSSSSASPQVAAAYITRRPSPSPPSASAPVPTATARILCLPRSLQSDRKHSGKVRTPLRRRRRLHRSYHPIPRRRSQKRTLPPTAESYHLPAEGRHCPRRHKQPSRQSARGVLAQYLSSNF